MSDSDPSLNDLIRAQRSSVGLSELQKAANRARLLASVAGTAGALGVSGGAKAAVGVTGGWLAPGAIAVALTSAVGVAYVLDWGGPGASTKTETSTSVPVPAPVAKPATVPDSASDEIDSGTTPLPASSPESSPTASGRSRTRSASPAPPAASSSLAAEVQLMHDVNVALKSGQPGRALALLEAPRAGDAGYMREEREAARVFALCQAGSQAAARAEAAAFLRKHPRSPLAARVSASCAPSTSAAGPKSKG